MGAGVVQRGSHAHDGGQIFRARPEAPLLGPAVDEGEQGSAPTHIQCTHTPGAVELVAGQGQHINVLGVHVDGQMPHRLYRVSMEGDFPLPAQRPDLSDGLDGANLIVSVHDGHQGGVLPDSGGHVLHFDNTTFVYRQKGDLKTLLGQLLHGVEDGVVLNGGGDKVLFAATRPEFGGADDGLVVRLAAAGGEVNLPGLGPDGTGHRLPGGLQRLLGLLAGGMEAGGIAPELLHGVQHGLLSGGAGFCGCGVVRVYHT